VAAPLTPQVERVCRIPFDDRNGLIALHAHETRRLWLLLRRHWGRDRSLHVHFGESTAAANVVHERATLERFAHLRPAAGAWQHVYDRQ